MRRERSLAEAAVERSWSVVRVMEAGPITDRLVELGMTPGARVEVLRRAPWSGPMLIRLRDFVLTMRPDAAQAVWVQPFEEDNLG